MESEVIFIGDCCHDPGCKVMATKGDTHQINIQKYLLIKKETKEIM